MKFLKYLLIGILFGIVMTKSEAISWYRIQEMFRFHSFHMYGIIGSALAFGVLMVTFIKRYQFRSSTGNPISFNPKSQTVARYLLGGIVFGLGWALTGACPGPLYTLIGNGFSVFVVVLASALVGTLAYGAMRHILPH
jgi:uncharacterized membrane protein YedE/YeeE